MTDRSCNILEEEMTQVSCLSSRHLVEVIEKTSHCTGEDSLNYDLLYIHTVLKTALSFDKLRT